MPYGQIFRPFCYFKSGGRWQILAPGFQQYAREEPCNAQPSDAGRRSSGNPTHDGVLITVTKYRLMTDEPLTYVWPRGTPLFGVIGLCALGVLLAAQPELTHVFAGKVAVASYFFVATLFCLHLYRFRVILDATSIQAGSFFLRKMRFADVVRATYVHGRDSGQIVLHASNGMHIGIGETLEDFRACVAAINARLPAHLSIPYIERAPASGQAWRVD
ncbi:hypothetical protein [Dyella telluris]|uniref:Uncharacterized protein n=1 Tax=Dyella telluris TaxID=2763498 RepID=A0A7G8Q5T2_9GAMM|nr:hypothetical protein [Dyella telluris]QNK02140.1 hypothetical protein H8F01_02950 [Dyella telluris]